MIIQTTQLKQLVHSWSVDVCNKIAQKRNTLIKDVEQWIDIVPLDYP